MRAAYQLWGKMETNKEHRSQESGNAMIYVLVAIVLFAGLSFTLSRNTNSNEGGSLSDERAGIYATELISYTAQVKSIIDQMLFSGTDINDLDFRDPSDATFNAGTQRQRADRVFHPEGGGMVKAAIPDAITTQSISNPPAGWYIGRFNNVEWTSSTSDDVILVAYQISESVCAKINEKINGSTAIPVMGDSIRETMIDASIYAGTNTDLTTDPTGAPICAECHEISSLCVQNDAQTAYGFYTIVADQ
jgi:hypothetical protein